MALKHHFMLASKTHVLIPEDYARLQQAMDKLIRAGIVLSELSITHAMNLLFELEGYPEGSMEDLGISVERIQ